MGLGKTLSVIALIASNRPGVTQPQPYSDAGVWGSVDTDSDVVIVDEEVAPPHTPAPTLSAPPVTPGGGVRPGGAAMGPGVGIRLGGAAMGPGGGIRLGGAAPGTGGLRLGGATAGTPIPSSPTGSSHPSTAVVSPMGGVTPPACVSSPSGVTPMGGASSPRGVTPMGGVSSPGAVTPPAGEGGRKRKRQGAAGKRGGGHDDADVEVVAVVSKRQRAGAGQAAGEVRRRCWG